MEIPLLLHSTVFHTMENRLRAVQSYFVSQNNEVNHYSIKSATNVLMNWKRLASRIRERFTNRPENDKRKRARLTEFEGGYEELVDLLCLTAHEGVHKGSKSQYARMRAWMRKRYPRVQKTLYPFWQEADEAGVDPFVRLFNPTDIEEVINCHACIENITRSRCAMEECIESLKTVK